MDEKPVNVGAKRRGAARRRRRPGGAIRIGISGWRYAPWRGTFYPQGLRQAGELEFAARAFPTIEINGTFYSLQRPESFGRWADSVPDSFVFAVKAPRFITHIKRLRDIRTPLANFLASGVLRLGPKLGPILWQLPPSLRYDPETMEAFLGLLPHTPEAALRLARRHDERIKHPWLKRGTRIRFRHAMEVRHESFRDVKFIAQLRRHGVALVVADTAGKWPLLEDLTADFVYVRLHGDAELYVSGYTPPALDRWARRIQTWSTGGSPADAALAGPPRGPKRAKRDVFVYFDNDVKVRAPYDAQGLAWRLGLAPRPEGPPSPKITKEAARTRWPGFGATRRERARVR